MVGMNMKNKAATAYARTLGSLAFAAGKPRAPALDAELSKHMAGRKIGDSRSVPEMQAWLSGWVEASLAGDLRQPCDCGSVIDVTWHGDTMRVFCCDKCWLKLSRKEQRQ